MKRPIVIRNSGNEAWAYAARGGPQDEPAVRHGRAVIEAGTPVDGESVRKTQVDGLLTLGFGDGDFCRRRPELRVESRDPMQARRRAVESVVARGIGRGGCPGETHTALGHGGAVFLEDAAQDASPRLQLNEEVPTLFAGRELDTSQVGGLETGSVDQQVDGAGRDARQCEAARLVRATHGLIGPERRLQDRRPACRGRDGPDARSGHADPASVDNAAGHLSLLDEPDL